MNENKLNPLLLCDFYKVVHTAQYPKNTTKIVSYLTPRMTRLKGEEHLIMFGLQGFIKEYLIEYFNDNFFNLELDEVVKQYNTILKFTLGESVYDDDNIKNLHELGYLPLQIRALPEGTRVPIRVPMIEITNTHPNFAWLVNSIETLMSCSLWHPMISANVGYKYRQIVNRYFDETVEEGINKARALGDFAMRGQESLESATKSSAGWLLSFLNTATIPSIFYLSKYYNSDIEKDEIGYGSPSTEHSVMCSNFSVDGNEVSMIKRLLTEIYPSNTFSMVADSYDYWNLVENILPQCRKEIEAHNGTLLIRGDSGDPIDIIAGEEVDLDRCRSASEKGTVELLWELFGGEINSKGYKVLNPKIKAIYGDSITPQRAEEIYRRLEAKGFSAENVVLGVGSFSMQAVEEGNELKPFTRDTFGMAVKATYAEVGGKSYNIFKNPKTDKGAFKKSQKGCCLVFKDIDGIITYKDELIWEDVEDEQSSEYETYFKDGKTVTEYSLKDIRDRLHNSEF